MTRLPLLVKQTFLLEVSTQVVLDEGLYKDKLLFHHPMAVFWTVKATQKPSGNV